MRRRIVFLAVDTPLMWPLDVMACLGIVPSLAYIRVHLAFVNAVRYLAEDVLWLDHR